MGAGYLGGSWLFINAVFGKRWHRIAAGFLPVTAFTIAMLLATILHRERFQISHFPFQLWLGLYVVTPILVPWMWFHNRVTDPGTPEVDDRVVASAARQGLLALGVILLVFAVVGFIFPNLVIRVWPWQLTPLTARVMSGWFSLLGVGGIVISRDRRWSAWKVGLQCILIWHLLVLLGVFIHAADFPGGIVNWYTLGVAAVVGGMTGLYVWMERRVDTGQVGDIRISR